MLSQAAEQSFKKGLAAMKMDGGELHALAFFEAALTLDHKQGKDAGEPRYRSFFGLCMVLQGRDIRGGLTLCREAAEREFFNPQMWLNLARAEKKAGHMKRAHKALLRAVRLAPEHPEIHEEFRTLGMRRRPPLPFLSRDHFLNVWLGKLTYKRDQGGR